MSSGPPLERRFAIVNKRGLHARASAKFVQCVERYQAQVRVSRAGETVGQPAAAVDGIALSFSVVPAALVLLSLVPLVRYGLRRGDIDDTAPELPRDHSPTDRARD